MIDRKQPLAFSDYTQLLKNKKDLSDALGYPQQSYLTKDINYLEKLLPIDFENYCDEEAQRYDIPLLSFELMKLFLRPEIREAQAKNDGSLDEAIQRQLEEWGEENQPLYLRLLFVFIRVSGAYRGAALNEKERNSFRTRYRKNVYQLQEKFEKNFFKKDKRTQQAIFDKYITENKRGSSPFPVSDGQHYSVGNVTLLPLQQEMLENYYMETFVGTSPVWTIKQFGLFTLECESYYFQELEKKKNEPFSLYLWLISLMEQELICLSSFRGQLYKSVSEMDNGVFTKDEKNISYTLIMRQEFFFETFPLYCFIVGLTNISSFYTYGQQVRQRSLEASFNQLTVYRVMMVLQETPYAIADLGIVYETVFQTIVELGITRNDFLERCSSLGIYSVTFGNASEETFKTYKKHNNDQLKRIQRSELKKTKVFSKEQRKQWEADYFDKNIAIEKARVHLEQQYAKAVDMEEKNFLAGQLKQFDLALAEATVRYHNTILAVKQSQERVTPTKPLDMFEWLETISEGLDVEKSNHFFEQTSAI